MTTTTYRAYNTKTGDWYAGSTAQGLEVRKLQHLKSSTNDRFHNSLRKNPEDWKWEVLSEVEGLDRSHEQEILDVWVGSEFCLNVSKSAGGGFLSFEACSKGGNSNTEKQQKSRSQNGKNSGKLSTPAMKNARRELVKKIKENDPKNEASRKGAIATNQLPQRKEWSQRGSSRTNSQKWMSTIDGFISNPGNVARHNISVGGDPKAKVKIS